MDHMGRYVISTRNSLVTEIMPIEISRFDLLCSTLFFQVSLYVMIRMARRAFTLGEVVLVAHGATALFLETVNISIIKVSTVL